MLALRRLMTATHVDQHGNAVVDADDVGLAVDEVERLIDRLVADLARHNGVPESVIRQMQGIPTPPRRPDDHQVRAAGRRAAHPR